jgi:hypothetical protein
MAKKKKSASTKAMHMMSAKELGAMFVAWFIGHSAVIYLANSIFPEAVVLGTHFFSPLQSLAYSMVVFTLITVGATPIIEHLAASSKKVLKAMDWIVLYFVINAVALWVVARFAEQLGFGVSSWMVVVALAAVMDLVQGFLVMKVTSPMMK